MSVIEHRKDSDSEIILRRVKQTPLAQQSTDITKHNDSLIFRRPNEPVVPAVG